MLAPDGSYVLIGHDHFGQAGHRWLGSLPRFLKLVAMSPFVRQLPDLNFKMPDKTESMALLKDLIDAGKITPVVDRTFPLQRGPRRRPLSGDGTGQGKVVLTV